MKDFAFALTASCHNDQHIAENRPKACQVHAFSTTVTKRRLALNRTLVWTTFRQDMHTTKYFRIFYPRFYLAILSFIGGCAVELSEPPENTDADTSSPLTGEPDTSTASTTSASTDNIASESHTSATGETSQSATLSSSESTDELSTHFDSSESGGSSSATETATSADVTSTTMCELGTERCECLEGEKCHAPLVCLSGLCVNDEHCEPQDANFDPTGVGPCQMKPWFWYEKDGELDCYEGPSYWCFCDGKDCDTHWISRNDCKNAHQDCP